MKLEIASAPAAGHCLESRTYREFAYNACRVPWRRNLNCWIGSDMPKKIRP
jgi:hypothetical protein